MRVRIGLGVRVGVGVGVGVGSASGSGSGWAHLAVGGARGEGGARPRGPRDVAHWRVEGARFGSGLGLG